MARLAPVAEALAGLRANEARSFHNKYDYTFTVAPAAESAGIDVPDELATRFTFERQNSKLASTIRGSHFVVKGEC